MQFRYIERCPMGYVEFRRNDEVVRMHTGEVVDVPDWLAAKLANNNHFEQVEYSDNLGELSDGAPTGKVETVTVRRGWPKGKPRKTQPLANHEEVHDDGDGSL